MYHQTRFKPGSVCDLALPYDKYIPSRLSQLPLGDVITFLVAMKFLVPERAAGLRAIGNLASVVCVPKASMHEDDFLSRWKYQIGHAGQVLAVNAVTVSEAMSALANDHLGLRVFTSNERHALAALRRRQGIHPATLT